MVKILPDHAFPLPPLSAAKSILVLKMDALGDCVLLSPFLKNLRSNCPNAKITIIAPRANQSLLETCPALDQKLFLANDWHQDQASVTATVANLQKLAPFDLAIVPRWEADYYGAGFLAQASGARIRISYSASCLPRKMASDPTADQFYTHTIEDKENRHDLERNLLLLEAIGGKITDHSTSIWVTDEDEKIVQDFLAEKKLQSRQFTVFAPGASLSYKIWPVKHWFEFTQYWLKEKQSPIVVIGSGDMDRQIAATLEVLNDPKLIFAIDRFNPRLSAALIKHSNGLIGADSFAKHCAANFKLPVVEISCHPEDGDPHNEYHSSRFGAWQTDYKVVQPATCGIPTPTDPLVPHPNCIERVSVENVIKVAEDFV